MALFKNTYSGLITKGLGMDACCGMLTMGFGLFKCTIYVPPQPPRQATGGYAVTPVFVNQAYTPVSNKMMLPNQKVVMITVKAKNSTWRKMFVVDQKKANIIVKMLKYGNSFKRKMSQIAESLSVTFKRK